MSHSNSGSALPETVPPVSVKPFRDRLRPFSRGSRWSVLWSDEAVLAFLATLVIALVVYPIIAGLRSTTLAEVAGLFARRNVAPVVNTVLAAVLMLPFSLLIAVPMAWLCTRTNLPWRRGISFLVGTSFVVPMLFTSIAYVFLLGPNAGIINVLVRGAIGRPLYDIFSFSGVVFIAVLHSYPLIFFTTAAGFSNMNAQLEESARVSGLSGAQVFFRITLALIVPSILAGVAFALATTFTMLSGPLILAVSRGIPFLTSEIFGALVMYADVPRAITLSLPLLAMTAVALWAQTYFLRGGSERFSVVSGKEQRADVVDLGRWRAPLCGVCLVPVCLSLILPFLTLLGMACLKQWWKGAAAGNFTLAPFVTLFNEGGAAHAIRNSLILSFSVAACLALGGAALAIALSGPQTLLKRIIRSIGQAPLGIAQVVAGVMVLLAWYGRPFYFGGTLTLLGLGYAFVMLPYAVRTCEAARGQIDAALVDAARVSGCSPLRTWRHVLLPLMRNGLFTSFVLVFLFAIKEFPVTAMLYNAQTRTLAVQVYEYFEGGSFALCGAGAVVMLLITFTTLFIARRLFGVDAERLRSHGHY